MNKQRKIHLCLIAILAVCLAVGCGFLLPEGQPAAGTPTEEGLDHDADFGVLSTGTYELVNPNAPQGEPLGGTTTEEGFVCVTYFDAPSGTDYNQQRAARLEEILALYDGVIQAVVDWDEAGQQARVTVSVQAPLTDRQEEAMRSIAVAVFPEGTIQLEQIQAD